MTNLFLQNKENIKYFWYLWHISWKIEIFYVLSYSKSMALLKDVVLPYIFIYAHNLFHKNYMDSERGLFERIKVGKCGEESVKEDI